MRKGSFIVPLSLAAMVALGYAGVTGSSGSLTLSVSSDEWLMVGSDRGLNIDSLIGTYNASNTGCANPGALVSAWQYDATSGKWKTRSCTYDATAMGYTLITSTAPYEGVWLHAGSSGGSGITVSEALGSAASTVSVKSGWNLLSTGESGVTFSAIGSAPTTNYGIFKDMNNGVKVYAYQGGVWKVWSPNNLTETPANVCTGLSAYEGFWVKVNSAKVYDMVATSGSGSSSAQFDGGSSAPVGEPGEGAEQIIQQDLTPSEAAPDLFSFASENRFIENVYSAGESNVTKASRALDLKIVAFAKDANDTVGATVNDYNISSALSRWSETNGTTTTITGEGNAGFMQILYDSIMPNGYVPSSLKGYAATLYGTTKDLNNTYNNLNAPGIKYYINKLYDAVDDFNNTAEGVYEDPNRDTNNSGKSLLMSKANAVKSSFDTLKNALSSIPSTVSSMKSTATSLYNGLVEQNASAANKNINYAVTTTPSVYVPEDNKSYTLSFSGGFSDQFPAGSGYSNTLPNLNLVFTINGTNYVVTVVGSDDNLTDLNGTSSSFVQDINSTISGSSVASYVEVTGNNAGTNGWEVNISGKSGAGNFNLAYGWVSSGASDMNNTVLANFQVGTGIYDVNLTVPSGHEFVPASPATYQVGTIAFPSTAKYKAGDEINLSFGSIGSLEDLKATVIINGASQAVSGFFEQNISFVLSESDIGATDAATRQNLATKIASQINSKESNLTATASGETVTVSTKTRTDGNNTLIAAQYGIKSFVNGINYNTMINNAEFVKNALSGFDKNVSDFVTKEGNSTGTNLRSLELNISAAYDATYAFVIGGTISNGNVYKDSLAKLYWNTDGVANYGSCTSSFVDAVNGWRLPTVLEIISLFGTDGALSSNVTSLANNTVLQSNKYLLAEHNSSHGWKIGLSSLAPATLVQKSNAGTSYTCVADYYTNGDSSYKFNDFYYYTDAAATVNRLSSNTSTAKVVDSVMKIDWMRRVSAGAFPTGWTTDGKTTSTAQADTYCTQLGMRLPKQAELRSLNFYFLKDYYANNKSGNSLSSYFPYDFSTSSGAYYWKDGSTFGVLNPTSDISAANMFDQSPAAGTAYKVICVKDQ